MATDGAGEVIVTKSQLIWREVKECLGNEDFDKAVQLCNSGERVRAHLCLLVRLVCVFCFLAVERVTWRREKSLDPLHSGSSCIHKASLPLQPKRTGLAEEL